MARVRGIKQPHPLGSVASRAGVSQLTAASGGATSSAHGGVKISALPVASAANDIDQLEVNQSGTSRRVAVDQIAERIAASDWVQDQIDDAVSGDSGIWYLKAHGAIGDGVTDDSTAVQAVITAAAGRVIDGGGLTYKIVLPLTGVASNTTIRNMTLDFSTMPAQPGTDYCVNAIGTVGSNLTLTSDTLVNTNTINIADTSSLAVDDLVYFTSTTLFDLSTSSICAQYGRVKQIVSATQFTTYTNVVVSFLTSAAAAVKKVNAVSGVTIRDCKFIGAGVNLQMAVFGDYTDRFRLLHCEFTNFDYGALSLSRSYKPLVDGCTARRGVAAGLAYGFTVGSGCYHAKLVNNFGEDLRHTVAIGGTGGINLHTLVANNHALNSKDAGVESHPPSMFTTFANNHIEMSSDLTFSSHDGIISQGAHTTIIGNTIHGVARNGIIYQPLAAAVSSSAIITGNKIVLHDVGTGGVSAVGVALDINATIGPDVEKLLIADNEVSGGAANSLSYGITVQNRRSGARVKSLIIARNQITDIANYPIYVRAFTGALYDRVNVSSNDVETTTTRAIYLTAEGTGSTMANVIGSGNIMKSSSIGLGLFTATGAVFGPGKIGSNIYRGIADNLIVQATGPGFTGVTLQDSADANTVASTNTTATILPYSNWWTFGRATAQTVTLPDPVQWKNTELHFRSIQAGSVDSATANVTPIAGGAATTVIFPAASPGKWAVLKSDGTTWRIVKGN